MTIQNLIDFCMKLGSDDYETIGLDEIVCKLRQCQKPKRRKKK